MNRYQKLTAIAMGDVSANEAFEIIRPFLANMDKDTPKRIYAVLRSWVWVALNERRRDDDLRELYNVLRAISSFYLKDHVFYSERILVLYELIKESISVTENIPIKSLLKRYHVREIILALDKESSKALEKSVLISKTGFELANFVLLTRLLLANGLIDRRKEGDNTYYSLTAEGIVIASNFSSSINYATDIQSQ